MQCGTHDFMLQPLLRASQIHARMGLLALRMEKGFGAHAILTTKERHANVGITCIKNLYVAHIAVKVKHSNP